MLSHDVNNIIGISKYVQIMIKQLKVLKPYLHLCDDFSVQFAVFPGSGERYVRHLDIKPDSSSSSSSKPQRKITAILYLNKEWEGGQLRIYTKKGSTTNDGGGDDGFLDIDPSFGKLVVFRSDLIEHEVLPSYKDRMAITFWASAIKPEVIPKQVPTSSSSSTICPLPINPIGCNFGNSFDSKTIFVSIAAYRDSECQHTLRNLFEMANVMSRVFVGVVWQGDRHGDDSHCFIHYPSLNHENNSSEFPYSKQIRTMELHWSQAKGPCWARHLAHALFQNEDYILQIDSHMRFRPNWDSYLINLLEQLKADNNILKPIITTYPLGYTLPNNYPEDIRPTLLVPTHFDDNGILRQSGRAINLNPAQIHSKLAAIVGNTSAIPCPLWAAGFNFSEKCAFQDVPYDPKLNFLFFGEEISMAARFFTHGYDFFSPTEAVVYHLWNRGYRAPFTEIKSDSKEILKEKAKDRVLSLLLNNSCNDIYGLGNARTLQSFEETLRVNFRNRQTLSDSSTANDWKRILTELHDYAENLYDINIEAANDNMPMKNLEVLNILRNYLKK
jgi:[Skp1-protein]-hydroxyproline N-acetylglucosaminyltransferase